MLERRNGRDQRLGERFKRAMRPDRGRVGALVRPAGVLWAGDYNPLSVKAKALADLPAGVAPKTVDR